MILNHRLQRRLRVYRRPLTYTLLLVLALDCLAIVLGRPRTVRADVARAEPTGNTTVYIATVHRNTEDVLRSAWSDAVVALVRHLGPQNVHFVAIESGSQDGTKEALADLGRRLDRLGASNTVSLGLTVYEQLAELDTRRDPSAGREPGWIWDPDEKRYAMRRIPYLSRVRNEAMQPLGELGAQGRTFDKVLWVNDVVFDTSDVVTLLRTRDGAYAAACAMDFKVYPVYYDTFALRDERGDKAVSYHWPWFLSPMARAAAGRGDAVRVESCWNGMVVFDAAPFYADPPLEFRGIDDSLADLHLEASECCLIHADNPLSARKGRGVWLNPNVRVGYNIAAYRQVQGTFPGAWTAVKGVWANRWLRWRNSLQFSLESATVRRRLRDWREATPAGERPRTEVGINCLINEKQIMWQNGWKHL